MGDFILYGDNREFARLDHLFVHTLDTDYSRRVFLKITPVDATSQERDPVLNIAIHRLSHEQDVEGEGVAAVKALSIIGLPALWADRLYIIPVTRGAKGQVRLGGDDLLYVNWMVEFL